LEIFWNKPARAGFFCVTALTKPDPLTPMTYFPHPLPERPAIHAAASPGPVRQALKGDILWNQPVFKAPALPIPNIAPEPLPFRATRITRRPAAR
jgi:hypothetical protein